MAIMTRIIRLCKADLHGVLDSIEDQGLLLKQYLRDMEAALRHKNAQLTALDHTRRRLRSELEKTQTETSQVETDLTLALQTGKGDIARMLVRKFLLFNRRREALVRQISGVEHDTGELQTRLRAQELQYQQLQMRASAFLQRAEKPGAGSVSLPEGGCGYDLEPSEGEIELELLRRQGAVHP